MLFNYRVIINILGILLLLNAVFMLMCIPISLVYVEGDLYALLAASVLTGVSGSIMYFSTRNNSNKELSKRDGYMVVTLGWLIMSFFGSLPYIFSGAIPDLTNAFFETISGFSTTGASVLTDIESVHKGILFWRSLTQWIGGMGIIVLTVAILPILGIGGMQLFVAEAPGISPDKLQPRIKETAKRLWFIYLGITLAETVLLFIGGMNFYDAVNHALTTVSTGGFSTKNASIAFYDSPFIQYVITFFMFLGGTNFTMTYFALHGNFLKVFSNEEFRFYLFTCLVAAISVASVLFGLGIEDAEVALRASLFQVVSIVTTTGYITADYTGWTSFVTLLFFLLMFVGASAGSTAGGVKIVRHTILIKNSILELKRQLHPNAVIPVRFNGKALPRDITFNILAFIMIYIFVFAFGSIVMSILGLSFDTAMGSVATCLGNIGPGIGDVGPVDNFSAIPAEGKWVLAFLMLLGRLELFTVLMLFTPYFYKSS
ncbi:MAG: TrkH family potassium uptake protein [Bacteroidota bacterium]